ncbi:protease complex subunit PrcB family protein [Paenibacillus antri]|uniref:Protease complex subunit PrcB family protein n=1 Tax=Paenibacillus antri TaxID=2582848 RepID=A0A5R9G3X5_9BACL|nr:S-layer homology domain-containing protein [Paenibacillus antri]TLS50471.1 protease complex subunit PrcB family protein [Paenibacillus antri]
MMKKWMTATAAAAIVLGTISSSALAFDDLKGVPHADKIMELRDRGFVNGVDKIKFVPHEKLTAQQAIPLIVKSMQLSLAHMTFVKAPEATDYFTKIPNDAWYAEAFIIAHHNGVPIDKDVNPNAPVTREQFVQWLMHGLYATGEYAWPEIYLMVEDEKKVSDGYMGAIQHALIGGIAELDENGKFRPQEPITRAEAAVMVRNAVDYVEEMKQPIEEPPVDPIESGEVKTSTTAVNKDVQKVVLDMGEKPHPGWGVRIEGIDFIDDTAVIRYSVTYPDPAAMYPMVISYPKAETYLSSEYKNITYQLVSVTNRIPDPDAPVDSGESSGAAGTYEEGRAPEGDASEHAAK